MALSQKYSGKILTPWFDTAEWKLTKDLIYKDSSECRNGAIDRLKVWKIRTPILSVGIEGTLILLEALAEKHKNLTDFELANIFSTALLRFLNICAANNTKQGTFYKTAEQNELPLWLITLRHDIAHDHKIPSRRILEAALNECLKWIMKKYWEVQEKRLKDYVICDNSKFREIFLNYAKLKLYSFYNENTDEFELNLTEIIPSYKGYSVQFLENHICEIVLNGSTKECSDEIVSILVEERLILSTNHQVLQGKKGIPERFYEIWVKTVYMLIETETIFLLINKLVDVTEDDAYDEYEKEIAALWISKLYSEDLPREHSHKFQQRVLKKFNIHTLIYLEPMMKFNGYTSEFIRNQKNRIKTLVEMNQNLPNKSEYHAIRTLKDLKGSLKTTKREQHDQEESQASSKRFKKLSNAEKIMFKGYPFGLLPVVR